MFDTITTDELDNRLKANSVPLVDVREVHEYRSGHVPGAVNIPLSLLPLRASELPAGNLHLICRSGARSAQACLWLARSGRSTVNVAGGTNAWIAAGKPLAGVVPA